MKLKLHIALLALSALAAASGADARRYGSRVSYHHAYAERYYRAASGHIVHRPVTSIGKPAGASARCRDGSWSFSESHRGTCSHHGGVSAWL